MATILIVEDDENTRLLTKARLKSYYDILTANDGEEALNIFYKQHIDLIIADIMMPNMDGYDLVKSLREYNENVPIIMLTAKDNFEDKRKGFFTGTDDYMTKPINYEELIWRIQALLRRAKISSEKQITLGEITLSANSYTITKGNEKLELPPKEFELIYKLLSYPEVIFTKNQLLEEIWGYETHSDENTIKTHINRLRNKLEGFEEFEIVTVRGVGYKAVRRKE